MSPRAVFPSEFVDLLSRRGRRMVASGVSEPTESRRGTRPKLTAFGPILDADVASCCVRVLERRLEPMLQRISVPVPEGTITEMTEDYRELLPKTMSVRSAWLSGRSRAAKIADDIGVLALLRSESLWRFAQEVTGLTLRPRPDCQVLCYGHGDYVGPHNDHHPQSKVAARGYVDVQLSLCNEAVGHQWLVYEHGGHFGRVVNLARTTGVSVYRLPFWHYTTPLVAKAGLESRARRWLLLSSFYLAE